MQGPHMAYSSTSDVKSFAFCYCFRIVHAVILFLARPSFALVSMWEVFLFPLTCQCDSAGWVAAAHRVVMDTLCVRLGLIRGLTLLSRRHSPSLSIVDEFHSDLKCFFSALMVLDGIIHVTQLSPVFLSKCQFSLCQNKIP